MIKVATTPHEYKFTYGVRLDETYNLSTDDDQKSTDSVVLEDGQLFNTEEGDMCKLELMHRKEIFELRKEIFDLQLENTRLLGIIETNNWHIDVLRILSTKKTVAKFDDMVARAKERTDHDLGCQP